LVIPMTKLFRRSQLMFYVMTTTLYHHYLHALLTGIEVLKESDKGLVRRIRLKFERAYVSQCYPKALCTWRIMRSLEGKIFGIIRKITDAFSLSCWDSPATVSRQGLS
jgi:hypothetical protein